MGIQWLDRIGDSFRDNTMITKIPKTSDTGGISKKKPPKKP